MVFVEYKVITEKRLEYIQYMQEVMNLTGLELYEGSEQEGLFVEIWSGIDFSAFTELKQQRTDPDNELWSPLHAMIIGGAEKIHIWHFDRVKTSFK